jgi:hypothetical protein
MLSVANELIMLSVVMLNVAAPMVIVQAPAFFCFCDKFICLELKKI